MVLYNQSNKRSSTLLQLKAGKFVFYVVIVQVLLGIFTVVMAVPLSLGLLHQLGAFFLFGATLFYLQQLSGRKSNMPM
jgi:cytochrome c oxidase assembly protein subunit 15